MRGRHSKAWGLAILCSTVGFYALLGLPATAHTPTRNNQHFGPDEFNGDGHTSGCISVGGPHCDPANGPDSTPNTKEGELLSDTNDGFGESYELRSVTDTTATFYEWYSCTDGSVPTVPGAACQPIATDTVGDPSAAPPGSPIVNSWSGSWNIGGAGGQEGTNRDIHGSACASDARSGGPPTDTSHCILGTIQSSGEPGGVTFANNVHLDDSSTTADHTNTTSGRIHILIDGSGTDARTFTHPDVHGAGLRNGQTITIIGYTSSPSVDAVGFCWDQGVNSATASGAAPNGLGGGGSCTHFITDVTPVAGGGSLCHASAPAVSGADCWTASISFPNANAEFALGMIEFDDANAADGITNSGSGDCAGDFLTGNGDDCLVDEVFVTTTAAGEVPGGGPSPTPTTTTTPPPADCVGTSGNDILVGTSGPDNCRGLGGNDTIRSLTGNDTDNGGTGSDTVRAGGGDDVARGGGGNDLVACGPGNDFGAGGPGSDTVKRSCEIRRSV
jgi:hypothetical protein